MQSLFVSGTDTDVGKTFVSTAIARGLRRAGHPIGVMKPIETGVPESGPADATALRAAAGATDALDLVCPLQFEVPATPEAAARAEGREISLEPIDRGFRALQDRHEGMLVEGAGGVLVPVRGSLMMVDLAARLGLPLLLVARTALGTINHTLLSLEACAHRNVEVLGVVLSHSNGALSAADEKNLRILKQHLGERLLAEIPFVDDATDPAIADAAIQPVVDLLLAGDGLAPFAE